MEEFEMCKVPTEVDQVVAQEAEIRANEEDKKMQLVVLRQSYFFYSVVFEYIERYFTRNKNHNDTDQLVNDMEEGQRKSGCRSFFSALFSKDLDNQKIYYGKTADEWIDFFLWTMVAILICILVISLGYVSYKYGHQTRCHRN